jgi:hypothetical protein
VSLAGSGLVSLLAQEVARNTRSAYNAGTTHHRCSVIRSRQINPITEHELYLKLFLTNGGGW